MEWTSFDSTWLIELVKQQLPEEGWLLDSLFRVNRAQYDGVSYYLFIEREKASDGNVDWEFNRNIKLRDPERGEIVLDILNNNEVAGMEVLSRYEADSEETTS